MAGQDVVEACKWALQLVVAELDAGVAEQV